MFHNLSSIFLLIRVNKVFPGRDFLWRFGEENNM